MKRIRNRLLLVFCALLVLTLTGCGLPRSLVQGAPDTGPTVSVGGQTVKVDQSLEQSEFTESDFSLDEATGRVTCLSREALTGIDVSSHQGDIDWAAVAGDGISFAMLRIGNRGYSQGAVQADTSFETNLVGARENGLKVGATSSPRPSAWRRPRRRRTLCSPCWTAGRWTCRWSLTGEHIEGVQEARTNQVDTETITACAVAFCRPDRPGGATRPPFTATVCWAISTMTWPSWSVTTPGTRNMPPGPAFAYAFDLWQVHQHRHRGGHQRQRGSGPLVSLPWWRTDFLMVFHKTGQTNPTKPGKMIDKMGLRRYNRSVG